MINGPKWSSALSLARHWVWFADTTTSATQSCLLFYSQPTGMLSLLSDAGTSWLSSPLGGSGVLQNTQCAVTLPDSSASVNGTALTLNLAMTFKPSFAGAKHIQMFATGAGGVTTGWVDRGTWVVPATGPVVTADSASVIVNLGSTKVIEARYADSLGADDLQSAWIWITNAFGGSAANSCLMYFDPRAQTLSVLDDSGAAWLPGHLGTIAAVGKSQCTVHTGSSGYNTAGMTSALQVNTGFSGSYRGTTQHVYIFAAGSSTNSGWKDAVTLTVP
jgi:hypothetical protein